MTDEPLTPHQLVMLRMLAEGWSHRQIAVRTGQSTTAVATALSRMYRRLDANNAPHAVAISFRRGLLS